MAEHEHKDEPVVLTSPARMARGIIIVAVTLAIGAAVVVTQWDNFFSQAPPVTRLQPTTPPPPPPVTAGVTTIAILSGAAVQGNPDYDPDEAEVPIGNKVVWVNQDTVPHTATSGTGPSDPDSAARFDTGIVNGGESSDEIEIDGEVGETIPYYCIVHPYMISQLTLVEAQEGGPTNSSPIESAITILSGAAVQGNPDYDPDEITVKRGNTVLVINADNVPHTVTSGTGPSDPDSGKSFDTGIMDSGDRIEINTANLSPATYDYYCLVHPYMTGKMQVTE